MAITKKQALEQIMTFEDVQSNPEVMEVLAKMLEQLEKPRKENPKKAAERDELTERVLAVLASQDKPCSIKELREMENGLGEFSSQKLSPVLKRLVEAGRVEKTTEKRVSMFRYIG